MTERSIGRGVRPRLTLALACALTLAMAVGLVGFGAPAVLADKSRPDLRARAWYWEDQRQHKVKDPTTGTDVMTLELPNPFCPGTPVVTPEQTCKVERLPVEVHNGDYATPNKMSALAFTMTGLLPGSEVEKFEVTLVEANDEQSQPFNADNATIKACRITEVFGRGEARLYEEAPQYECTRADPVGKRRALGEGKAKRAEKERALLVPSADGTGTRELERADDAPTHAWTFDLTPFAQAWADEGALVTSIMLVPTAPKGEATPQNSTWRVVFVGEEEGANGVQTQLVFEPPPPVVPTTPPTTPFDDDDDDDDFDDDTGSETSTTTTTTGGLAPSGSTVADLGDDGTETPVEEATDEGDGVPPIDIQGEVDTAGGETGEELSVALPWYAWLVILLGLIMYSLIRSAVIEKATGARPDGVLAQIQRLNSERRGGPLEAAAGPSRLAPLAAGLRSLGRSLQPVAAGIRNGGGRLLSFAKARRSS